MLITLSFSEANIYPISKEIMVKIKDGYREGKGESYIENIVKSNNLNEEEEDVLRDYVDDFFDSDLFIKTGSQYLSALFTEKDLQDIMMALADGYLNTNDDNYPAAKRLQKMFDSLDPYVYKYIKHKTQNLK